MGKKYLNTKSGTLEDSILGVWQNAAEELDPVNKKAVKKKFKNRKDKDIDNDGDVDSSDEYLHKRRKAVSKAMGEGKMSEIDQMMKDGKSAKEIAKALKMDVNSVKKVMGEDVDLEEGTKQVLAHGGKGQYKAVRDGSITKIMYKGKVVGTADFDSGADSFFASIKGVKGQKSFDDAQAMVDYFAKNKITEAARVGRPSVNVEPSKKLKTDQGKPTAVKIDAVPDKKTTTSDPARDAEKRRAAAARKQESDKKARERITKARDQNAADAAKTKTESYEVGTDEYRKHTQEVTPGQELKKYGEFKVQSMREAMHKVWGINEKNLDKEDKDVVKSNKAMTGGRVAKVDMKPSIEDK